MTDYWNLRGSYGSRPVFGSDEQNRKVLEGIMIDLGLEDRVKNEKPLKKGKVKRIYSK